MELDFWPHISGKLAKLEAHVSVPCTNILEIFGMEMVFISSSSRSTMSTHYHKLDINVSTAKIEEEFFEWHIFHMRV